MYENETFEVILDRMLNNLPDNIDKREGAVAYDMLAPKASELAMAYIELSNVLNFGFASTTYGEFLDRKVYEVGLSRYIAEKAIGEITISGEDGTVIPRGTVCYTDFGIRFLTNAEVTIPPAGSVTVGITAENGGRDTNVIANSITNIEIDNVTCTNREETQGGTNTETDEQLIERYRQKVTSPGISGNINHYKQWALSINGVGGVRVIPVWNGNGTVKVICIDSEKMPVTDEKAQEIYDYIETQRPIGAEVTVVPATGVVVDISVDVEIGDGYELADITTSITNAIGAYIKSVAFVDNEYVRYNQIGTIILDVDGVIDFKDLTVNSEVSNVITAQDEVPVLGTVTVL